jgi:hypothetical protein
MRILAIYLFGIAFAFAVAIVARDTIDATMAHATQQLFHAR